MLFLEVVCTVGDGGDGSDDSSTATAIGGGCSCGGRCIDIVAARASHLLAATVLVCAGTGTGTDTDTDTDTGTGTGAVADTVGGNTTAHGTIAAADASAATPAIVV